MSKSDSEFKGQRAYASGVNISFFGGLTNFQVDLLPTKATDKSTEFVTICPDCKVPTKLSQRYLCLDNPKHGPYLLHEAARGKEIEKVLHKVSEEEIAAVKQASLPQNDIMIQPFGAKDVEAVTRPTGTSYRLRPTNNVAIYAAVVKVVDDSSKAFVAEVNLRGSQKMYRLHAWNGQLVLQELVRPSDLAVQEVIEAKPAPSLVKMMKEFVANEITDFDPSAWANQVKARAAAFDAEKANDDGKPAKKGKKKAPVSVTSAEDDLLAALTAAMKPKKPAKKKVA